MKPLTIDELRALKAGDWVWVIIKQPVAGDLPHDGRYYQSANYEFMKNKNKRHVFNGYSRFYPYSAYGTKWIAYKNKEQAEEEQCANCDRNISDELPKVDVDGKRYCHQCYEDKCKGEVEVNRLYVFVIDHEEIYRFICKNTTQALRSFSINISTIDWLRKDKVSYGGAALMLLKSYALSEQGLGDERIEGFMFVKKQHGELTYYPCGKAAKIITTDVYTSFTRKMGGIMDNKEMQIKDMAKAIKKASKPKTENKGGCTTKIYSSREHIAEKLYNAGYRKADDLSVELGQAKAYIGGLESELTNAIAAKEAVERDKANLERTIEEIYEALHVQGITLDCDGNVVPANKTVNKYERLTPKDKIEVINVNHGDDMTRLILYAFKLWALENMLESGELIEVGQKERRGE